MMVPFFEVAAEPGDETWWEQEINSKPADKKPESNLKIDLFLIEMIIILDKDFGFKESMPNPKKQAQSSELFLNNKIKTESTVFFAHKSLLFVIYSQNRIIY